MTTDGIAAKLKNFAKARPEIVAVYLYGSYANGAARPTSDFDVAVLLTPSVPDALKAELELGGARTVTKRKARERIVIRGRRWS